jgi:XTP/dITP diphosphohydrolase
MRLVLATHNAHKAREFERLLPGFEIEAYPGGLPAETGETFRENAELKADHVFEALGGGVWVLADDSGIEAAALGGRPGVRSARFAGEQAGDAENLRALLDALANESDRSVAYVAELVLIDPDGRRRYARGELRGTLAAEPRGEAGFGYDPAFVPEGETRTVGEMSSAEKDAISHRARAAASLMAQLRADEGPAGDAQVGDVFEETCDECGEIWRMRLIHSFRALMGAPTPPVGFKPEAPGSTDVEGCPKDNQCETFRRIYAWRATNPEYAEWRRSPHVAEWYARHPGHR